jgi:hypothetical protein
MKKIDSQQAKRKMDERIKGGNSFWARINNDTDFRRAKREIQERYRLPLNYDIRLNWREWYEWIGYDKKPTSQIVKRGQAFLNEVDALFKKYEIPEAWHLDFIGEIWGRAIYGHSLEVWSMPKFQLYKDEAGNLNWRCIITPETDLRNPMNLDEIQRQQKVWAGDPPTPIQDKAHPRKLDWRPVYEWRKRHPLFTIGEIAKKLKKNRVTVSRALERLEKENSLQK